MICRRLLPTCSTKTLHSGPNCRASSLRSRAASAGLRPPVEMAICSGPRLTTAGQKKSQCAGSSTELQSTFRAWQERKTASLADGESVAAMARKAPSRSRGENRRRRQTSFPASDQARIRLTARGLITVTRAPQDRRPSAFTAATRPAPITTHLRPANLVIMGYRLIGDRHKPFESW